MYLHISMTETKLEAIQRWSALCGVWPWTCTHIACAHRYIER